MSRRLRLASHVSVARLHGEAVVLDLTTGSYFSVNASGASLLDRLAQGATREQLIEGLVSAFGVPLETASADVDAWLDRLQGNALLATDDGGGEGGPRS